MRCGYHLKKQNNNKTYGLGKERELKKMLLEKEDILSVDRCRGSFGVFDLIAWRKTDVLLMSVKSVRAKNWSQSSEIKKLKEIEVPEYCTKVLAIYWSPRSDRKKKGWEFFN